MPRGETPEQEGEEFLRVARELDESLAGDGFEGAFMDELRPGDSIDQRLNEADISPDDPRVSSRSRELMDRLRSMLNVDPEDE